MNSSSKIDYEKFCIIIQLLKTEITHLVLIDIEVRFFNTFISLKT